VQPRLACEKALSEVRLERTRERAASLFACGTRVTSLDFPKWRACSRESRSLRPIELSICKKLFAYWSVMRERSIGSLSSDVFEGRTSTGSGHSSLLISLDTTKFLLLSVFTLKETICPRISRNSRPQPCKKTTFG